ncbi:MAG: HDOD domain-containing protein [Clostridiales bacterium]|nr:HDOD domain-containing protein [Clostridiales bacterium]
MNRILIVDDEKQILKAMKRLFSETEYDVLTAENGVEALELLEKTKVDMIICDMKMPIMDGYHLLSRIKKEYPNMIRISLSGYAEETAMYKATLHNISDYNIFKPWNNKNLLEDIHRIFASHRRLNTTNIHKAIEDIELFKEMPANCKHLLNLIENEDQETLIYEIEQDTEISNLLMKVASSSIYGAMPVSVKQAAIYIGMHNLKCFLYWAAMVIRIGYADQDENLIGLLWKHAYSTNKILLFLYEAFLHKQPPEASLFTGLLLNTGLIALIHEHEDMYEDVFDNSSYILEDLFSLENEKFGVTHTDIGAYLLNRWDLPFPIVEAALYHHNPQDPLIINKELVNCVHIAEYYAWKFIYDKNFSELEDGVFEQIEASKDDFENRLERYMKKVLLV